MCKSCKLWKVDVCLCLRVCVCGCVCVCVCGARGNVWGGFRASSSPRTFFFTSRLLVILASPQGSREGTMDCKLHLYPKFYNHNFLFVCSKHFGFYVSLNFDWYCPNFLTNNFILQFFWVFINGDFCIFAFVLFSAVKIWILIYCWFNVGLY